MAKQSLKSYCKSSYKRIYKKEYDAVLGKKTSVTAKENAERTAQRVAIKNTFKNALNRYPNDDPSTIWDNIYLAHVLRKAKITSTAVKPDLINDIVSSHQSWLKASGHAFEAYIEEQVNPQFKKNKKEIRFVLQKELTALIKKSAIHNTTSDLNWLKAQCKKDVFDLYAIYTVNGDDYVFGCIQSKTSIRDRVTRDREPSQNAMKRGFWSIAITLNGEFLSLPKFKDMVNGNGSGYKENGWHGMYVMSNISPVDRIYSIRKDLSTLIDHADKASREWIGNRNKLDSTWKAKR